jgi:serine protease AprX
VSSRWTLLGAAAAAVTFGGLLGGFAGEPRASAAEGKVSQQVMLDTANGQETSFIIYMGEQADLSAASQIADQDARGWYVYDKLKQQADATQGPVKAQLDAAGIPYRSFWAVNMIVAQGDRSDVLDVAARPDVAAIETNEPLDGIAGEEGPEEIDEGNAVDAIEGGVTQANAPPLWTLGFTGQGMVVANQDTGMRWTHNALRTHYRGWGGSIATSDHNYNWHDSIHAQITSADGGTASPATNSCGRNLVVPCDDHGHGTHTTGTTVGDDGVTNQVGVAPGAKWIGCRNMDTGNGRASTYTECFQFFLAPTKLDGTAADPTKRPDVMNNSWGCPQAGELCAPNVMKSIVENSEASGIFIEASAGNDGPGCNTVTDPPAIYDSAFSTGSITSTNAISSFSSRGSVTVDGSGRMKPDLVARGSTVRSTLRTSDTAYGNMSGTSMAGPHVVGAVAVLWSARARLVRDVPRTKWLLTRSANPAGISAATTCGGTSAVPNNHYGWGRLDVKAAYDLEPSLNQTIAFDPLADRGIDDADFTIGATASSTLPVAFAAAGSCTVAGTTVHITGPGTCTITASQGGLDAYGIDPSAPKPWYPADDVVRSFEVTYPFAGFSPPVGNRQNGVQAGSALPIKFTLGGDRGADVLADGYPMAKACDAADATLASTSSTSPFSFADGQYNYVWKTDKAWKGQCVELVVRLDDNTEHRATFQFK